MRERIFKTCTKIKFQKEMDIHKIREILQVNIITLKYH